MQGRIDHDELQNPSTGAFDNDEYTELASVHAAAPLDAVESVLACLLTGPLAVALLGHSIFEDLKGGRPAAGPGLNRDKRDADPTGIRPRRPQVVE